MKANSKRYLSTIVFSIGFSLLIYQSISLFLLNNPYNPIIGTAINQFNPLLTIIGITMGLIGGSTGGIVFRIIFSMVRRKNRTLLRMPLYPTVNKMF